MSVLFYHRHFLNSIFSLDYFLVFFQHYYWHKKNLRAFSDYLLPRIVEDMYKDCLAVVRPKLKHFKSLDEARQEIDKLRKELYPNLFAQPTSRDGAGDTENEGNLETIHEDSENDDMTGGETSEALVESDCDVRGNDEGEEGGREFDEDEEIDDLRVSSDFFYPNPKNH